MKKRILSLLLVAGLGVGVAACDDDPVTRPLNGSITGTVSADGEPLQSVTVEISGEVDQSNATQTDGTYSFAELPAGTYTVSIVNVPQDVVFDSNQQTVSISLTNPDATANFDGSFSSE